VITFLTDDENRYASPVCRSIPCCFLNIIMMVEHGPEGRQLSTIAHSHGGSGTNGVVFHNVGLSVL
jgi:hypothetical protein